MSRDGWLRGKGQSRLEGQGFQCSCCGNWHAELPLAFHSPAPATWSTDLEAAQDSELGSDMCVIRGEEFFIRGLIRVPIVDDDRHFEWGVWVSLSKENFMRTGEAWETEGRESAEPMFGWLTTALPTFTETTLHLKALVQTRPVGLRPLVQVEDTDHPLAIEQREGITRETLVRRVEQLLHPV